MTGTTWFRVRIALMAVIFIGTLFISTAQLAEPLSPGIFSLVALGIVTLVCLALIPVILLLVMLLQTFNPMNDATWDRPTHCSNPFHLGNPLLFFHFLAYYCGAFGIGFIVNALWNGSMALAIGIVGLVQTAMLLSECICV